MNADLAGAVQGAFRQSSPPAVFHPERPAWQREGACLGVDPAVFFPERGADITQAKAICAGCPVREACLEWALDSNEQFGVWGGMSPDKRGRLRRSRRAA